MTAAALGAGLRGWLPTGGGLRDEDWLRRHRLLTLFLAAGVPAVTLVGAWRDRLNLTYLGTVLVILVCVLLATTLRPRRLPSLVVALGFTAICGGLVALSDGLTEAHFTFFIAVAALALYRDWAPFGAFLVATTLYHVLFGTLASHLIFDHHGAMTHPWLWALLHGAAVLAVAAFQIVGWALTEREEARADGYLAESQAQLGIAFDQTPVPMVLFSPDGRIVRANPAYMSWLALPDPLPPGYNVKDLPLSPLDDDNLPKIFETLISGENSEPITRQYRRHDDGSVIWVEAHSNGVRDRGGRLRLIFVHSLDVTRQHEQQADLRRQVREDALTGLLSRAAFEEDLTALLAGGDSPASVVYLDVDRFKSINDLGGHRAGDDVLRALSARLLSLVPEGSLVARPAGDEFVIALAGSPAAGVETAAALLASFAEPLPVAGNQLQLTASVGVAVAAGAGQAEEAVLAADTAMYAAKHAGGNRLKIFNEHMRTAVRERLVSESLLRDALAGDREVTLPVWFQPIVAPGTGRIVGAEALVRMQTADGRLLGPGAFIAVAEETGLVMPLGEHVLAVGLRHLRQWSPRLGYVSVNVSPRQLADPDFVPALARLLGAAGLDDPARLVLEITETALLSTSGDLRATLDAIKALGVRIALDDFGTGYSSLTWLQSVPADIVKLDRSFVAGLAHDPRKASIISAVLWLARALTMSVVAEGVEELEDWNALLTAGCPAIQGYYFSPPVPPPEFEALLGRQASTAYAGQRSVLL